MSGDRRLRGASDEHKLRGRKALTDLFQTRLVSPEWDDSTRNNRDLEDAQIRKIEGLDGEGEGSA